MPDIIDIIARRWKQMLGLIVSSLLVVGIITFLRPKKYLSVATAVPASSFASDKSKIFNENIQALYSTLGTTDDLDLVVGTGKLDTVYTAVSEQFNLYDHYKVKEQGDAAVRKAALLLKKNTKVMKSEYGELKVKVWDTDKNLAPQLANAIIDILNNIHQRLQAEGNLSVLTSLKINREKAKNISDSVRMAWRNADSLFPDTSYGNTMQAQVKEYDKLINEYQLMVDSKPPVLIIVEQAKATDWPDKPKKTLILIATAFLSFLFSLLVAMAIERRKKT
ncbi:MAG: hypothetical protein HZB42_14695 [Sphingobacteriales bacterium]|nr:hypothetical protein [Sphingobacteriales bacterium]